MSLLLDLSIAALCLALACGVLVARTAMSSTIAFIGLGLALTLAWVRLGAVDVALTEAAVGSGVTGLVLLRAAGRIGPQEAPKTSPATHVLAAMASAGLAGLIAMSFLLLPEPAPSLAPEAMQNLAPTGLGNPVTAVLVVYRGLDTLLEAVVLLLALVGVWSLAPDAAWGGAPAPLAGGRVVSPSLSFLARILPPFGVVLGLHLLWTSADEPGGAFQGGAVLAAMWLLTLMGGHAAPPVLGSRRLRLLVILGPLPFMLVGALGIVLAGSFLGFPEAAAKPFIVLVELALTLAIAVTLGLLVLGPAERATQS